MTEPQDQEMTHIPTQAAWPSHGNPAYSHWASLFAVTDSLLAISHHPDVAE